MFRKIFTLLLCCSTVVCYSQNKTDSLTKPRFFEVQPEFPGGFSGVYAIIRKNIKYPKYEYERKIGGVVEVGFTIDTLGNVTNIKIIQGVSKNIDKEAIRVIGLLNGWKPGTQNGKKVKVKYTMPITFAVEK